MITELVITEAALFALFHAPNRPLTLETVPLHHPQPETVRVRVRGCTLCASDLHTITGRRESPVPSVLGHEIVGAIEAFGENTPQTDFFGKPLTIGSRVVWSVAVGCGICFRCRRGMPQKCLTLFKYGHERWEPGQIPMGGLSTHCQLRPNTTILPVPPPLSDGLACIATCAGATVMAAVRSAGEVAGRDVLVMGTGVLGLIACALLRERGAFRVIACDLSPERRTVALSFGATDTCSPKELPKFVAQVTHGNGVDIGLDLSGSHKAVKQMIDLLAIGGVGVLVGSVFPSPTISLTPETVVRRLLTLRGVHNYTPTDLAEILRFLVVAQCAYPWNTLLADEYPLTAINEAITHAECTPPLGRIFIRPDA